MALELFKARATLDQLRIIPTNAPVVGSGFHYGYISIGAFDIIKDGEYFTIDDQVNPAVTFEFDDDSSVVETNTLRQVAFVGGETEDEQRDLIITAVNNAPTLNISAKAYAYGVLRLQNTVASKRVLVSDHVADENFISENSPVNRYVFCLGSDLIPGPNDNYDAGWVGDYIAVKQSVGVDPGVVLVRIQGRFRQPAGRPIKAHIVEGAVTASVTRHVRGGGHEDVTTINTSSSFFATDYDERDIYLEGATIAGDYKIFKTGINFQDGAFVVDPKSAVLYGNGMLAAPGTEEVTTAFLYGAHWRMNVYRDGASVFTYDFNPANNTKTYDLLLPDITLNVSKADSASVELEYRLELARDTDPTLPGPLE